MPIPFLLLGLAGAAGLVGLGSAAEAMSNNEKAQKLLDDAQWIYDEAKNRLEEQRQITSGDLESLGITRLKSMSNDIGGFTKVFKEFKKVDIKGNIALDEKLKMKVDRVGNLKNMELTSLKAEEIVKAGVSSLGAGALAGIASYGGAMMFASASTGTAIATLSGAAATNATLAWFGGGSLAAGGLGMAGGTAVLGGIVAGPVLAVAGLIMAAKSEENLAAAKKTHSEAELAVEKMDTMSDFMERLSNISNDYNNFINEFSKRHRIIVEKINKIFIVEKEKQSSLFFNKIKSTFGINFKVDFTKLTLEDQKTLQLSWLMTQVLYSVLSAPLLTKDGDLDGNVFEILNGAKDSAQNMIETRI